MTKITDLLDMSQLQAYERDLAAELKMLEDTKRRIEYDRLQIKQTKQQAVRAKKDLTIRFFIDAMPKDSVTVMPAPGTVYVTVNLGYMGAALYHDVPGSLGLEFIRTETDENRIGAPVHWFYRKDGVQYIITKHVK